MTVVALALPLHLEERFRKELVRHGHSVGTSCESAGQLADSVARSGCEVAIVAANERYLSDGLLRVSDALGVRLIAVIESDADRRFAANTGLRETVAAECPWAEVEAAIAGSAEAAPAVDRRGQVIAVWGPAGAPGRTTLAITIAAEIAAAGFSVALADVDTHGGSIAPALGLLDESPGFAAACRLAGARSLDREQLERIGQRYLSGHGSFWVLTGIGRTSRWPELSADRVVATIDECRNWVDYTVLDTGFSLEHDEEISSDLFAPRRNAATIAALREADHVVAVGAADPVGLSRFLRSHADLIETIVTDHVTVVMNRIRASAIGLNPSSQVEQTLRRFGGIGWPVLVPHDQTGMDAAVLTGRTLRDVAPRSPARAAIGQFVHSRILPPVPAPAKTRRAFRLRAIPDPA